MNAKQVRRVISGFVVAVGVVLSSGNAQASTLAVDSVIESEGADDELTQELPSLERELLTGAEASVPAPFVIQFSAEFELAFSLLVSSGTPELESLPDLSCARGCVLEYNACMWTEYDQACEGELDVCSSTCSE